MSELEAKINCRYCQEAFVLFEDLQQHRCTKQWEFKKKLWHAWLKNMDAKARSFEGVLKGY